MRKSKLLSSLSVFAMAAIVPSSSQAYSDWQLPLTAEDSIIQRELEWAENAMEKYRQKTGSMPLRSSIRAAHVHTEEWRRDAVLMLAQAAQAKDFEEELLARTNNSRFLRGIGSNAATTGVER